MGADNSKGSSIGNLFLQTDKSAYFGGETVTGKLYLNLLSQYPGNKVFLKLKGKEFCAFTQTQSQPYTENENGVQVTKHRDVDIPYDETREVIKMIVPMLSWAVLLPGQYTIPFAFMLPADLPSTFHQEGKKYIGDISYTLTAIMEPPFAGQPKLKHKQAFIVRQPIKSAMQGVGSEIKNELKCCGCQSMGNVTLKAKFEKNFYAPGEVAQVILQLDNTESKCANETINFSLKQKLTLKAKGKEKTKDFVKVQRSLTEGVPIGAVSDSNFIALNLPPYKGEVWTPIKTIDLLQHLLSLKDDNDVLNSATRGKFITSEYYLEVACPMNGCCLNIPAISCPIEIYYPEIQLTQPQIPVGWAPQEMGVVNLSMTGPSVTLSSSKMNVNVNVDPVAMAANTMLAAGNIMTEAAMMGGMNMTVTNQQPGSTIQSNNGNVTFEVNNQMPQDGFNMTMNTTTNTTQHYEHSDSNGFHASFTVNH